MASVGFVLALYHEAYLLPTLRVVERIGSGLSPRQTVFVANHDDVHQIMAAMHGDRSETCEVLRHDNSDLEFGAYQAGINRLLARMDADWIVIANDTCATHGNFAKVYRDRLVAELGRPRDHPVIVGRIHALSRSYQLAGFRTNRWIQSNLFAINRAALRALGTRVFSPETGALITDSSELSEFFSPSVDPVLRDHLGMWLFRTRGGPHWYASEPLQPQNAAKMARKARSILHEKHLSAALDACGAEFVDFNQLRFSERVSKRIDDKLFHLASLPFTAAMAKVRFAKH